MSILVDKRTNVATDVQEILTYYGCIIDYRLFTTSLSIGDVVF